MMPDVPERSRRRPSPLLVVSLILNLFLIGLILGFGVLNTVSQPEPERRVWGLRMEMETYERALPEEYREGFREELTALLPDARERWAELRELRGEVARMVTEPEPDRAAIAERLAEIRRISTEVQAMFQATAFDAILALPPEAREDLDISFEWHRDNRGDR